MHWVLPGQYALPPGDTSEIPMSTVWGGPLRKPVQHYNNPAKEITRHARKQNCFLAGQCKSSTERYLSLFATNVN